MIYFEDFLPQQFKTTVRETLLGNNIPWFHTNRTTNPEYYTSHVDETTKDSDQFVHGFFMENKVQSDYYNLITPFLVLLENSCKRDFSKRIFRIKANLLIKDSGYPENKYNIPHIDGENFESFLYYVNDSDGDTVFFQERFPLKNNLNVARRVTPKSGDGILFDSDIYHASTPPRVTSKRVVINFVFSKE